MGHTITTFRGQGVNAHDAKVEIWLFLLARKVDQMPEPPPWLRAARAQWHRQASWGMGLACPDLDRFLDSEAKIDEFRTLVRSILDDLTEHGVHLSREFLNEIVTPQGVSEPFTRDLETEWFLSYGRALLRLLAGQVTIKYELV